MSKTKKNFVSSSQDSVRMFEANWMEALSKVHFSVPLFIYLPIVAWLIVLADKKWASVGYFAVGIFAWTFAEYFLHRFLFHWQPKGEIGQRMHFIFHGVHHDYPNDKMRLVMPPSISIPMATTFFLFYWLILPKFVLFPFFSGFLLGYLFYDMTHYAVHHFNIKSTIWRNLKDYHMKHHYFEPDEGYGVTSSLWDNIFGTKFKDIEK
jgi:sterol desaturase/sphingolipid hydroxylase (fatty acid hydroxylase superfamily)